jgi:hypothetical protein
MPRANNGSSDAKLHNFIATLFTDRRNRSTNSMR